MKDVVLAVPPATFRLDPEFLTPYQTKTPPFGFDGLGELTYLRTYSRLKEDGTNETWWETCRRVVEGTYRQQERHIRSMNLGWDPVKGQASAQEMYDRIFCMKFLPPGRGLWAVGSTLTEERGMWAAANNCAFVSTEQLDKDVAQPFTFLMDASMLGIGVGFDTKGAGKLAIKAPGVQRVLSVIPDTREGWVQSVEELLLSFTTGTFDVVFDYSTIRPAGLPIKGFGGVSAGPEPLTKLHTMVREVLTARIGGHLTVTDIVDIMNMIGQCVVAGNVRRSAEIAFGAPGSEEFLDLKNPEANPTRNHPTDGWSWTSNNSIFAELGMAYGPAAERVALNGEPGFAWLENMRAFGRMGDKANHKDKRVMGGNPCLEQSLESYELCCLVETFPANHASLDDYERTLKFAYLYAKTVTLGMTPWPKTNRVMARNRRIGCSMSGVVQAIAKFGIEEFRKWCESGYQTVQYYDKVYSDWLAVPQSIKTTSIKPSGTVSLLAGATPGIHFPESRHYIRRIRLGKFSALLAPLRAAGYPVEDDVKDASSSVVEIPVRIADDVREIGQVSMWEQLALAAFMQRHWADNQVSCTVTFDPVTEGPQIKHALDLYQYQLKGISFLPRLPDGAYAQMPYETITAEEYARRKAALQPLSFVGLPGEEAEAERFCTNDTCII